MASPILVGVNDLFFSAKIDATARQLGVPLKCLPTCDHVLAAGREAAPPLIILDFESVGGDLTALIRTIKSDPNLNHTQVVAFGRHTNAETLAAVKDAGADQVMPRSDFVQVLPELLGSCAKTPRIGAEAPE